MEINRIYNIALFGGTFDPFHMGHYELLKNLNEEIGPDRIYIIPTGHPYFKENVGRKVSPAADRIGMTRAGLQGLNIPWEISTVETDKDTPSYSIETIRYFRENGVPDNTDHGHLKIWFMCGSDLLFEIDKWYRYREILSSVTLAVIPRGDDDMDERLSYKKFLTRVRKLGTFPGYDGDCEAEVSLPNAPEPQHVQLTKWEEVKRMLHLWM